MGYSESTFSRWGEEGCFPKLEAHTHTHTIWFLDWFCTVRAVLWNIAIQALSVLWNSSQDHYQQRNEQRAVQCVGRNWTWRSISHWFTESPGKIPPLFWALLLLQQASCAQHSELMYSLFKSSAQWWHRLVIPAHSRGRGRRIWS